MSNTDNYPTMIGKGDEALHEIHTFLLPGTTCGRLANPEGP